MTVIGACSSRFRPIIPDSLINRIEILYTCELTREESVAFSKVLLGLEALLKNDNTVKPELWAHVIFMGSPSLELVIDEDTGAAFTPLITYPVYKWRAYGLDEGKITLFMVEELCHCFWSIRDEIAVKEKDKELMALLGFSVSWPEGSPYQ